jgi:monoamine oxidase
MAKTPLFQLLRRGVSKSLGSTTSPGAFSIDQERPVPRKLTRREIVSMGGSQCLSLAALLKWGLLEGCTTSSQNHFETSIGQKTFNSSQVSKIAIIGGGISGLTLAYRLSQHGVPTQVFEGSPRLGGRVSTFRSFNNQNMFIDRGGEFVDTGHLELIQLCKELGVGITPLKTQNTYLAEDLYLAEGKVYSEQQMVTAFKPLASKILKDQELLKDGDSLSIPTFDHPLSKNPKLINLDKTSLAQYLEQAGIDRWARDLVASAYLAEYGLDPEYQSSLNLLTLIDPHTQSGRLKMYGDSDEAFRIQGGSDTLVKALGKKLESHIPIFLEHQLIALRDKITHIELVFNIQGKTRELKAEKVVLTLPPPLLASIDLAKAPLDPKTMTCIQNWGMGTSSKIMLGFKNRLWETLGSNGSAYLTPYGQCWDTSRMQKGSAGILSFLTGGRYGKNPAPTLPQQALYTINQAFPGAIKEYDGNQDINHWALNPWARGAFTCPTVGHYTTLFGAFNRIQLNGKLFFVGEHASIEYAGYMNGAVNSAQRVADTLIRKRRLTRM